MTQHHLPPGWVWTTISEITQPVKKVQPKDNPSQEFIYLDISSIDNIAFKVVDPKRYIGQEAPSRARQSVKAQDVLFSTVRTYLMNIAQVPEVYHGQIASTGFSVLRSQPGVDSKYLFYYCLTPDFLTPLEKLQRGTSYPAVRDRDVRAQPFPLPPLAEQQRIVDEIEAQFTRLEAGVAALERAQANLRRYRASLLKAACEGQLVPQDPTDEPAAELLARILAERRAAWEAEQWEKQIVKAQKKAAKARRKAAGRSTRIRDMDPAEWLSLPEAEYAAYLPTSDKWKRKYSPPEPPDTSELPDLPEGWEWTSLNVLCNKIQDGTHYSPKIQYDSPGEGRYLYITAKNVRANGLDLSNVSWIDEEFHRSIYKRCDPEEGDVLLTKDGVNTGVATINTLHEEFSLLSSVALLKPNKSALETAYLNYYLNSPVGFNMITGQMTGTAIKRIILKRIKESYIPLPPLAEQQRIVAEVERRLSVVAEVEAAIEANLKRAGRLRQAILKQAFAGLLVPQNPADEPASALLARIRAAKGGGKK